MTMTAPAPDGVETTLTTCCSWVAGDAVGERDGVRVGGVGAPVVGESVGSEGDLDGGDGAMEGARDVGALVEGACDVGANDVEPEGANVDGAGVASTRAHGNASKSAAHAANHVKRRIGLLFTFVCSFAPRVLPEAKWRPAFNSFFWILLCMNSFTATVA